MSKGRVEAFSDGVLAIIITIMVLELRPPHESTLAALGPLLPDVLSYAMSFIYIGIYWNNHHHLFQVVSQVDGRTLWANLHLLFWLSLIPFTTAWMGESHFTALPVALYGAVLLCAGLAYLLLTRALLAIHERDSLLAHALGHDTKGKVSVALYLVAIALSRSTPWTSCALYFGVALIWIIPDRRIERVLGRKSS